MKSILQKFLCLSLAIAIACAPFGCASQPTFRNPTPETVGRWVHYGDPVTVVKKSGEEEQFTAWVITDSAVGSGHNTPIPYADMREIRKERIDGGNAYSDLQAFGHDMLPSEQSAGNVGAALVILPLYIGGCFLLGWLARSSTHW